MTARDRANAVREIAWPVVCFAVCFAVGYALAFPVALAAALRRFPKETLA